MKNGALTLKRQNHSNKILACSAQRFASASGGLKNGVEDVQWEHASPIEPLKRGATDSSLIVQKIKNKSGRSLEFQKKDEEEAPKNIVSGLARSEGGAAKLEGRA